jgi:hypothetical protein
MMPNILFCNVDMGILDKYVEKGQKTGNVVITVEHADKI